MPPRGQQIRNYVTGVLDDPSMTEMERTRDIHSKAQQYGVTAQELAENSPATMNAINRNLGKAGLTLEGASPYQAANQTQNRPQYGLSGLESALGQGSQEAQNILQETGQQVEQTFNRGVEGFLPFMEQGQQASGLQARLSGAMGPEEQAQAFEQYQASPYVEQARENAEQAIVRNAAATGTARGGNVLDELYQNAAGMFMQDFGNQFQRAGQVAGRGVQGAQGVGNLASNLGGIQAELGSQSAQIPMQTAGQVASARQQAGRDIANQVSRTTSALSNLTQQQGAGTADIIGQGSQQVVDMFNMAGQGDAQAKQQLATTLSNLAGQEATQLGSQPIVPGQQSNLLGQVGRAASGIGGLLSQLPNQGAA